MLSRGISSANGFADLTRTKAKQPKGQYERMARDTELQRRVMRERVNGFLVRVWPEVVEFDMGVKSKRSKHDPSFETRGAHPSPKLAPGLPLLLHRACPKTQASSKSTSEDLQPTEHNPNDSWRSGSIHDAPPAAVTTADGESTAELGADEGSRRLGAVLDYDDDGIEKNDYGIDGPLPPIPPDFFPPGFFDAPIQPEV
ncbi:hypothetical protein BJV77DRAFT_966746 [Russula vinacea]|nr:hypothetical protein BJV77DRAFT_966746 [Russula vinacea]